VAEFWESNPLELSRKRISTRPILRESGEPDSHARSAWEQVELAVNLTAVRGSDEKDSREVGQDSP
jgi:hypothetical protein